MEDMVEGFDWDEALSSLIKMIDNEEDNSNQMTPFTPSIFFNETIDEDQSPMSPESDDDVVIIDSSLFANVVVDNPVLQSTINAFDFSSSGSRPRYYSVSQKTAFSEIKSIVCAVCFAHQLPLALTWIPYASAVQAHPSGKNNPDEKPMLCIEESACFWRDSHMEGFVRECRDHFLEQGQGIVGKAKESNQPLFHPDVKGFEMSEYPLVHHARKFGLGAAIAVSLQSSFTGAEGYMLELFLPVDMKGAAEQELLLFNIAANMERIYKNLKSGPTAALPKEKSTKVGVKGLQPVPVTSMAIACQKLSVKKDDANSNKNASRLKDTEMKDKAPPPQVKPARKRPANEKIIDVNDLQQYFTGSIGHAAKAFGVCASTIKRVCRVNGIPRWPSRKINKVDRCLKKMQNVLEGVKAEGLTFDPDSGKLTAAGSLIEIDLSKILCLSKPASDKIIQISNAATSDKIIPIQKAATSDKTIKIPKAATSDKTIQISNAAPPETCQKAPTAGAQGYVDLKKKAPMVESSEDLEIAAFGNFDAMPRLSPSLDSFLSQVGWDEGFNDMSIDDNRETFVDPRCSTSGMGGSHEWNSA